MTPELLSLQRYPMAELQARKADLLASGQTVFDFGTGDPIEPTPSFIRAAATQAIPEVSQYPTLIGDAHFRTSVAHYCQRRYGVSLDPDTHIISSNGSKEAIFHLPMILLRSDSARRRVIYGTPGYPVYQTGCLFAGGIPHPITLQRAQNFRLDLTTIPADVLDETAICWLNYPHNPTGATVDLGYLREQAACAAAHGIYLVNDECYCDLYFGAEAPPSLLQIGADNCLSIQSCSKRSGMTGYRSGFIAGAAATIAQLKRWRATMGVGSPAFITAAATAAWQDDEHVHERRHIFAQKYHLLANGLQERAAGLASGPPSPPASAATITRKSVWTPALLSALAVSSALAATALSGSHWYHH